MIFLFVNFFTGVNSMVRSRGCGYFRYDLNLCNPKPIWLCVVTVGRLTEKDCVTLVVTKNGRF